MAKVGLYARMESAARALPGQELRTLSRPERIGSGSLRRPEPKRRAGLEPGAPG